MDEIIHEWYDSKIILRVGFVYIYLFIYAIEKRKHKYYQKISRTILMTNGTN